MKLDHIAVSGASLEAATDWCEEALGMALLPGGQHDVFATHNALLGLDGGLYLEAIAIDPFAPEPDRPRWFDLDNFRGEPRLTNWICATEDLDALLAALPFDAGAPVALTRGSLRWKMAVPASGKLPFDNLHPALIEWQSPVHPSAILGASGCALRRLLVAHPEARTLQKALAAHFDDVRVVFETGQPALVAEMDTPHGLRILR
jgi:catechol 2,3-dioxygenase-like lactoylglutathione lyase family enzyme